MKTTYKQMYMKLAAAQSEAIEQLQKAMQEAEEILLSSEEEKAN